MTGIAERAYPGTGENDDGGQGGGRYLRLRHRQRVGQVSGRSRSPGSFPGDSTSCSSDGSELQPYEARYVEAVYFEDPDGMKLEFSHTPNQKPRLHYLTGKVEIQAGSFPTRSRSR